MERIDLAQDRDNWRSLMNTAIKFKVQINDGKSLNSCGITLLHGVIFYEKGLKTHLTKRVLLQ